MTNSKWTVEDALPAGFAGRVAQLNAVNAPPSAYQAAFNELVLQLKYQRRTGWVDRDVPNPESIGDHMYRMALMAWQTPVAGVDREVAIRTALAHDIAEAVVGDLTPYCGISAEEKHDRERKAIKYMAELCVKFNKQFGEEMLQLWGDYEAARTPEARFIKDIDKVELWDQTKDYERQHAHLDFSSFDGLEGRILGEEVREMSRGINLWHQVSQAQAKAQPKAQGIPPS